MNLRTKTKKEMIIDSIEKTILSTGFYIELPEIANAKVKTGNGFPVLKELTAVKFQGTIEGDYSGIVCAISIKFTNTDLLLIVNHRLWQKIKEWHKVAIREEVNVMEENKRGEGAF